jgi:hypothetical protein
MRKTLDPANFGRCSSASGPLLSAKQPLSFIPAHRPGSLFAASQFGPACHCSVFLHCAAPRRPGLFSLLNSPYTPESRPVQVLPGVCSCFSWGVGSGILFGRGLGLLVIGFY